MIERAGSRAQSSDNSGLAARDGRGRVAAMPLPVGRYLRSLSLQKTAVNSVDGCYAEQSNSNWKINTRHAQRKLGGAGRGRTSCFRRVTAALYR